MRQSQTCQEDRPLTVIDVWVSDTAWVELPEGWRSQWAPLRMRRDGWPDQRFKSAPDFLEWVKQLEVEQMEADMPCGSKKGGKKKGGRRKPGY